MIRIRCSLPAAEFFRPLGTAWPGYARPGSAQRASPAAPWSLSEFFNMTPSLCTFPSCILLQGGAFWSRITGAVLPRIGGVFTGED